MRDPARIGIYMYLAIVGALLALALNPIVAQQTGPAGQTTAAEGTQPAESRSPGAFGVAEIQREAEDIKAEIQSLVLAARPGEETQRLEVDLEALKAELSSLAEQYRNDPPEKAGLRRLLRMEADWDRPRARLESWHQALHAKTSGQQASLDALDEIERLWRTTRDEILDDPAADAVMDRVEQTLAGVEDARSDTSDNLAHSLELEEQVLNELSRVRESLARIVEARELARNALVVPEQPPLWRIFSESEVRPLTRDISDAVSELGAALSRFLRDNTARIALHALLSVGLLALLLRMRRRSRELAFEQVSRVLDKPISATLLLSLLLARWISVKPPELILKVILALALIPLMRVLPSLIPERMRRPLYCLGALLAIGSVEGLVAEQTSLERLLELGFIGVGLAGLFLMLRTGGPLADPKGSLLWRNSRRAAWVAVGLLAVALVANVAGNVALGGLITDGVFLSAYIGVVFLATYFVLVALSVIWLERAKARSFRAAVKHGDTILGWTRGMFRLGLVVWWIYSTLGLFQVRESVLGFLGPLLSRTWTVSSLSLSIGSVLIFLLTLWVSVLLSKVVDAVLSEDVLTRLTLPRGIPATIARMARYGIVTIGVLAAATALGIELAQFTIIAGALSVGVGFGLQDLVKNFSSGMILAFERPIHTGDTIATGPINGTVTKIGLRSSVVRTFEGAEVIVPNGNLIASEVTNWTLSDRMRRMSIAVGVAYGTDPRKVEEILLEAATRHEKVVSFPEAYVLFVGFGTSSLDFEVRFWTNHYDTWIGTRSEVTMNVNDALAEAGIQIPFPQRDVHLRTPPHLPPVSGVSGGSSDG